MLFRTLAAGLLLLSAVPVTATPVTINIGSPGGTYNDAEHGHFITFTTGAGLHILDVTMTLSDSAIFDTADDFFGILSEPFAPTNGSAAGVGQLTPAINGVADGVTSFLMTFTAGAFQAGETFSYNIDIDGCGGGDDICEAAEMTAGANDVFFSITLAGAGFQTTVVSGFYNFVESLNREGSGNTDYARVTLTGDVPALDGVPEPGTFVLLGGGLLAVGVAARRRRK